MLIYIVGVSRLEISTAKYCPRVPELSGSRGLVVMCVAVVKLERVVDLIWFAYQDGVKHPHNIAKRITVRWCSSQREYLIWATIKIWYEEALWRLTIMSRFAQRCAKQQEMKSGTRGFWLSSSMRALASKACLSLCQNVEPGDRVSAARFLALRYLAASADVASTCCKKTRIIWLAMFIPCLFSDTSWVVESRVNW